MRGPRRAPRKVWFRAGLGRVVRRAQELVDPTPLVARRRSAPPPLAAVVAVYRRRNAERLGELLADLPPEWPVRLWALDEAAPALSAETVGTGPGLRSPLLNKLVATLPEAFDGYIVLSDDDYRLTTGDLASLVASAAAAGLDLCQPAHCGQSHWSHKLTIRRLGAIARRTGFVEIGPVVVVAPTVRGPVLPLDDADGMGWGTDAAWAALALQGTHLGIVDWVRVRHLHRPGAGYEIGGLRRQFQERIDALGGTAAVFRTYGTWRPWQRRPPWED